MSHHVRHTLILSPPPCLPVFLSECLELVGEERGYLVVVRVDGPQGLGVVHVQPLEELLREQRIARLARVEAVRGLCGETTQQQ